MYDGDCAMSMLRDKAAVPGAVAVAGFPALFGLAGAWLARRRKQKLAA